MGFETEVSKYIGARSFEAVKLSLFSLIKFNAVTFSFKELLGDRRVTKLASRRLKLSMKQS